MTYLIKFYSKARGEVKERRVDAPNEQTAVKAICNYYGVSNDDIREIIELEARYDALRKEREGSAKEYMERMIGTVSESIRTECREFSYIASELHKRKIETIIDRERGDIQLRGEATGKTVVFGSLSEVKAFALGWDWCVENADNMAFCGLRSPICKEEI